MYVNEFGDFVNADCHQTEESFAEKRGYRTSNAKCKNMRRNTVGEGGYGDAIATGPVHFALDVLYQNGTVRVIESGGAHTIRNWRSGDELPKFRIIMLDFFFQAGALPSPAAFTGSRLSALSPGNDAVRIESHRRRLIQNPITEVVPDGRKVVTVGAPTRAPGAYSLNFWIPGSNSQNITVHVIIRSCIVDEKASLDGTQCVECDFDQFNFDPLSTSCTSCPENAGCAIGFIVPREGHWNSFLCSPYIQRCINAEACRGGFYISVFDLERTLEDNMTDCIFSDAAKEWYRTNQCEDGYQSHLCGSCKDDLGRVGIFTCRECLSRAISGVAVAGSILTVTILAILQIRGNLEGVEHWTHKQIASIRRFQTPKRFKESKSYSGISDTVGATVGATLPQASANNGVTQTTKDAYRRQECQARWKFVELLKVCPTSF